MSVELWFISSAFRIGDFVKDFAYNAFKMGAMAVTRDERKSDLIAGGAGAATYTALTAHFTNAEMANYYQFCHRAFEAEKGCRPGEYAFSDMDTSENPILRARIELAAQLQGIRYSASALPMLPSAIDYGVIDRLPEKWRGWAHNLRKHKPPENAGALEHLIYGYRLDNRIVYAAFAALYLYETFGVRKTGTYELTKINERKDVGRHVEGDALRGAYQRMLTDAGQQVISRKQELNAIKPLFDHLAEKVNTQENFDLQEIVYLYGRMHKIGLWQTDGKGNEIRDKDGNRQLDPEKIEAIEAEIANVEHVGLEGIAEIRRKDRLAAEAARAPSPVVHPISALSRAALDAHFSFAKRYVKESGVPDGELVSGRDPLEIRI